MIGVSAGPHCFSFVVESKSYFVLSHFKGEMFYLKICLLSNRFSRDFAGTTFFHHGGDEA